MAVWIVVFMSWIYLGFSFNQSVPAETNQGTLHSLPTYNCARLQPTKLQLAGGRTRSPLTTNPVGGTRSTHIMWLWSRYPLPPKWSCSCYWEQSRSDRQGKIGTKLWNLCLNPDSHQFVLLNQNPPKCSNNSLSYTANRAKLQVFQTETEPGMLVYHNCRTSESLKLRQWSCGFKTRSILEMI